MDGWNTTFLLGRPIFRGYVSFREGKSIGNLPLQKYRKRTKKHQESWGFYGRHGWMDFFSQPFDRSSTVRRVILQGFLYSTLVFQNPPVIPSQEVFGGPTTYSQGMTGRLGLILSSRSLTFSPLKSYRIPIGKDRLPFPTFFRGKLLNFGGVPPFLEAKQSNLLTQPFRTMKRKV